MSWVLDVGAILGGIGGILAAIWSRKAKTAATTAAEQTNGPIKAAGDLLTSQSIALDAILDGQRSQGHQIGEIRSDMGRMDERLTGEVADLRDFITLTRTPAPRRPPRRTHRS